MTNDNLGLDDEALHYYGVIYRWHKLHGLEEYERKYPQDVARRTPPFQNYQRFLERMPPPEEADPAAMSEWSGVHAIARAPNPGPIQLGRHRHPGNLLRPPAP